MKTIKTKVGVLLTLSFVVCGMLFNTAQVSAASNPASAPTDWAFEASSVELNDAIVAEYPSLDDGNGFITKTDAKAMTGTLDISSQNITGTMNGIENFIALTELNLSDNQLTGEIPSGLGDLSNLNDLDLSQNHLTGEIPSKIGNLNNLVALNLYGNQLRGKIPTGLADLSDLTFLDLSYNQLTGEIPSNLDKLTNLSFLDMSKNKLQGEIPNSLGKLNNLTYLILHTNQLSSEIPSSLGNLSNLSHLNLSNNQFTGEIPSDLSKLSNLKALILFRNQLTGEIPSNLSKLSNLSYLDLSLNQFTGEIPSDLSKLSNLVWLYLYDNQLSGEIPSSLGDLNDLLYLDLCHNQLTGEIPSDLGDLTNLSYLFLNDNQLSGEIPDSLDNLSILDEIDLSNNNFTSILQSTYDFITTVPVYSLGNQTHTDTLKTAGTMNTAYPFDALLAYEQFPNYGITFQYTLTLPDATTSIITPSIVNGKVTIAGSDLPQAGSYTLVANGTSTDNDFTDIEYTTKFLVDESIDFISASVNGEKDKATSTKIIIDLSKTPDVSELTIEDISLTGNVQTLTSITKDSLTPLGNGSYELAISGTWVEGAAIDIVLTKTGAIFTPDTHSVTLHTKLNSNIAGNENNSSDNNTAGKGNAPETGDSNFSVIILSMAGLLISSGYLATRKKEQK